MRKKREIYPNKEKMKKLRLQQDNEDLLGISLHHTVCKLRKSPAFDIGPVALHAVAVALALDCVPEVVCGEEEKEEGDNGPGRNGDGGGLMSGDEPRLETIDIRHTGTVPEDEHPAPLLVEDVPRGGHALFSLNESSERGRCESNEHTLCVALV